MNVLLATKIDGIELALVVVSILLGIAIVVALIAQIAIIIGYIKGNRMQNSLGLTGGDFARRLLDQNGMPEVQVKKCTFLRMLVFGNHYSISKRTVYLRRRTIDKTSVTSVAIAAQKVALAEQHRDGNKAMIIRSRLQGLGLFAPSLFIPLVIAGFLVDVFVTQSLLFTIAAIVIGLIFIVLGFVVTLLNIPVEKKAIVRAQEWLGTILTEEENVTIRKVFRSYMIEYVMLFVIAVLRIIQLILKLLSKAKN